MHSSPAAADENIARERAPSGSSFNGAVYRPEITNKQVLRVCMKADTCWGSGCFAPTRPVA